MRKVVGIIFCYLFVSCNAHLPDVSGIKVHLEVRRFENDFFNIDTNHIFEGINRLQQLYPLFATDFFDNILGLNADSVMMKGSAQAGSVKAFLRDYRFLKDSADKV